MASRSKTLNTKCVTIEGTVKPLGSFPPPKNGRGVADMDKFMGSELAGAIILESRGRKARSGDLGFFLDVIFASFKQDAYYRAIRAEDLLCARSSLKEHAGLLTTSSTSDSDDLVHLYDAQRKRWNWRFTPTKSKKELSEEAQMALFLNTLMTAVAASVHAKNPLLSPRKQRFWMSDWSSESMPGATGYQRKPDLILVSSAIVPRDEVTWLSPKAIGEYSRESFQPASRLGKTMDTKAYLVMVEQPWRRFVLGLSLANEELRVHFYDRSGGTISPPFNIHAEPDSFLYIVSAFVFGIRSSIGFDMTIQVNLPPSYTRRQATALLALASKKSRNAADKQHRSPSGPAPSPLALSGLPHILATDFRPPSPSLEIHPDAPQSNPLSSPVESPSISTDSPPSPGSPLDHPYTSSPVESDSPPSPGLSLDIHPHTFSPVESDSPPSRGSSLDIHPRTSSPIESDSPPSRGSSLDIQPHTSSPVESDSPPSRGSPLDIHPYTFPPSPSIYSPSSWPHCPLNNPTPPPVQTPQFSFTVTPPPPESVAPIGTITVRQKAYTIIDILFSSTGFLGRGTVCYLVCSEGVYYVVKDYWVRNDRDHLNEVNMMRRVKGIEGVPELVDFWSVKIAPGITDKTQCYREEKWRERMKSRRTHVRLVMKPCARPLTMFKTKKELISCIRDILRIQKVAVEERGILHRDCSLNNAMIEDTEDGARGFLLDWEFAVEINEENEYDMCGTGTLPFLSTNLLDQLENHVNDVDFSSVRKSASASRINVKTPVTVTHTYADDIESLFYVFIWLLVLQDGPLGRESDAAHENTFLSAWSEEAARNFQTARSSKYTFLVSKRSRLESQISPYFSDLVPLAESWRQLLGNYVHEEGLVPFDVVLKLLDDFLAKMPDENDAKINLTLHQLAEQHRPINNVHSHTKATDTEDSDDTGTTLETPRKRVLRRKEVRSMGNYPVKRFKAQ